MAAYDPARLKKAQEAAGKAHDRMLSTLIGFTPCAVLKVEDVKFIAEWCRTVTFDAIGECAEDPKNG